MKKERIDINVPYDKFDCKNNDVEAVLSEYRFDDIEFEDNAPAVIVCPGGAYFFLCDREGEPVVNEFAQAGIKPFMLEYSVAPNRFPSALMELAVSIKTIRENSEKYNIDPDRIFVCGFSAGGHLCASMGTLYNKEFLNAALGTHKEEIKPNGVILSYPVITSGEYTHMDSCINLLGEDKEKWNLISLEKQVDEESAPVFIWTTAKDTLVPMENSMVFVDALNKAGVPVEFHLFPVGDHGLSTASQAVMLAPEEKPLYTYVHKWFKMAIDWIKNGMSLMLIFVIIFMTCFGIEAYAGNQSGEGAPVRVGYYNIEGFQSEDEQGNLQGYNIDILELIAAETGWKYEYVEVGNFKDAVEKIENGEIDLFAPCMKTDEYEDRVRYCKYSIGSQYIALLGRKDDEKYIYRDFENFNGMKVVAIQNHPSTQFFLEYAENLGFKADVVYKETFTECIKELENGNVEAMVATTMIDTSEYKMLARFSEEEYYYVANKENKDIIFMLDNVLQNIKDNYPSMLEDLHEYHFGYELQEYFSREDLEFVGNLDKLRVAYVPGRVPVSFYNSETSQFDGISRKIFDQISEISGLEFEYVELPYGEITYDYLLENEIDLITGVEYNNVNINTRGVQLSSVYFSGKKVVVRREDYKWQEGKKVKIAVATGSKTLRKAFANEYPDATLVEFDTNEDCFDALLDGEVDVVMQNQYVVDYYMAKPQYDNLIVVPLEGMDDRHCFSVVFDYKNPKEGDSEYNSKLIAVLNKAISQISEDEFMDIVAKETAEHKYEYDFFDFLYKYRMMFVGIGTVLVVLVIIEVYIGKLKKKRLKEKEFEEEERRLQQKRYQMILDNTEGMIYEISLQGGTGILSERIREKFGWDIPKNVENFNVKKFIDVLHIHPEDQEKFEKTTNALQPGSGVDDIIVRMMRKDGAYMWCKVIRIPLVGSGNKVISIIGRIEDVDEEMKEKEWLEYRAKTDRMTGLLLKQVFENEITKYLRDNYAKKAALVFIDMDYFKDINDKLGHLVGDKAIKDTADRIRRIFEDYDLIARFGGDEFCVFVMETEEESLEKKMQDALLGLRSTYRNENNEVNTTASIGVAYSKVNTIDYSRLIKVADEAVYEAKQNGRNQVVIKNIEN